MPCPSPVDWRRLPLRGLLIKLMGDPDHDPARLSAGDRICWRLGALFYFVPYILGVQANAIVGPDLANLSNFLVTNTNPVWAVGLPTSRSALLARHGSHRGWLHPDDWRPAGGRRPRPARTQA